MCGAGLCPFVFEFLIEETSRSFDTARPIDVQARTALRALSSYDAELAERYEQVLVGTLNVQGASGFFFIEEFAPNRADADQPVTPENVAQVIVDGCRYKLWGEREAQLLALRKGFSTRAAFKEPIDLASQLVPFRTPDLLRLIQGNVDPVGALELVERCICWPWDGGSTAVLEAGFPRGSVACALLRQLLEDDSVFTPERRVAFLKWATSREVVPASGLSSTPAGKIKLRFDAAACAGVHERQWPLPYAMTCSHQITLADYTDARVLASKLLLAIDHTGDGFDESAYGMATDDP